MHDRHCEVVVADDTCVAFRGGDAGDTGACVRLKPDLFAHLSLTFDACL